MSPVDFKKIIEEIEASGVTTYKLSLMVHRRVDRVHRWKNGQQPKHYEGEMLLMIHREMVPRETTENGPSSCDSEKLEE